MRVRITKPLSGSIDGIQLSRLSKGHVYDVYTSLACYLLSEGMAEPAPDDEPIAVLPIENQTFQPAYRNSQRDHPSAFASGGPGPQERRAGPQEETGKLKGNPMRTIAISLVVSMLGAAVPVSRPGLQGAWQGSPDRGLRAMGKGVPKQRNEGRGGALGTGAGVGNELVLTMVKPESDRKAVAYSITGDREKELARRVGQEVEVIGVIEDEGKPGSERFGDLPRIKMTAWVPLKDSCPQ